MKYTLRLTVAIEERDERGGFTGGRLNVNEERTLNAATFDEIAGILGRYHQLTTELKAAGLIED